MKGSGLLDGAAGPLGGGGTQVSLAIYNPAGEVTLPGTSAHAGGLLGEGAAEGEGGLGG